MSAAVAGNSRSAAGSSCPKRARNAWFLKVTKIDGIAELTIMYKNTKQYVAPFSKTKSSNIKIPWGTPVKCTYLATQDGEDLVGEFQFHAKRHDRENFKESVLNSFEGGVNMFSKRITALIVERKQHLLAIYLSLLPHSFGFIHHREGYHNADGLPIDSGFDTTEFEKNGGSLADYREFVKLAHECSEEVESSSRVARDISSYFESKRKSTNPTNSKTSKKSKAATIDDLEDIELTDAEGLENEFKNSYVGMANIPLGNISISSELEVNVHKFRVRRIMDSMLRRYDPSLSVAVVCPVEGQTASDLKNLKYQKYVVVHKCNTIAAFKELDKSGDFSKLTSHEGGTVLCFVLRSNSAGLIHYGNLRSNEIQNQFTRKTKPQDLLRIYQSLCEKSSPENSKKVVERMCKLSRIGPNENVALRKIITWSPGAVKALMEVITRFERYETMDVNTNGKGYQKQLALGEKMTITNELFKQLGKVDEGFFLANHDKILKDECSLKDLVLEHDKIKQIEKVVGVLCIIADHQQFESLVQLNPGKFEKQQLEKYVGAEIRNGLKNDKAVMLESYYISVIENSEDGDSEIKFIEYEDLKKLSLENDHFEKFDVVVLRMEHAVQEVCFDIVNGSLLTMKTFYARLLVFSSETQQHEVLSFLRNQGLDNSIKILPVMFHCKPVISGEVSVNILFSVLFGRFSVLRPPISLYQSSIDNIGNLVDSISPPKTNVAVISDVKSSLVEVHSKFNTDVSYFGTSSEVEKFKLKYPNITNSSFLSKDKNLNPAPPVNAEDDLPGPSGVFNSTLIDPSKQMVDENDNLNFSEISGEGLGASQSLAVQDREQEEQVKQVKRVSDIFDYKDDDMILEIMARKKVEAEELAARIKAKTKGRKVKSMTKMVEYSLNISESKTEDIAKKLRTKNSEDVLIKNVAKPSNKKISKEENEGNSDYSPSIEEVLKIPDCIGEGGKTMDEWLDEVDKEIALRRMKHEEEMVRVDESVIAEKKRQEEREDRRKLNAVNRDKLEVELTEEVLRRMFRNNLEYLKKIESGQVESSRQQAYHRSCMTRHALYYHMITDPFTDDQLDWTLDEISKVWMKNKEEQMEKSDFIWKVILAECFIKFYMDVFGVSKMEAEQRISETPLREESEEDDDKELL